MKHSAPLVVVTCALLLAACGGGSPTQPRPTQPPAAPVPPPPPPAPTLWSVSGTVNADNPLRPVSGARVEIADGADAGRFASAGDDGRYLLSGLQPGQFSIRVNAEGFDAQTRSISLTADLVADFTLRPIGTPPPPPGRVVAGSIVDGLTDGSIAGAGLTVEGLGDFKTGADGSFRIEASESEPEQLRKVTISSASTVVRQTRMRIPGPDARLTLIPSAFDLTAFNQMIRGPGWLSRWVDAPRLTIQTRVLQFTTIGDNAYTATDATMSEEEVNELAADLAWGLPQLTGDRFGAFAEVRRETAAEGTSVQVSRTREIVVARFVGLTAGTGFWGYGRWGMGAPGHVVAGIVMLDRDFELSGSQFRRSLRVHELGHSLGYNHVTARPSVMNSSARVEPNDFDRSAAKLAFQRPPDNRAPDTDPDEFSSNIRWGGFVIWRGDR